MASKIQTKILDFRRRLKKQKKIMKSGQFFRISDANKKNSFSLEFMSPVSPIQWGSENRTCPVFEWLTLVRISNGPVFKWSKNKMAAKLLA